MEREIKDAFMYVCTYYSCHACVCHAAIFLLIDVLDIFR